MSLDITETEWLLQCLTAKKLVCSKYSFALPQTVIFRDNQPVTWYYSSKDLDKYMILTKRNSNMTMGRVRLEFATINPV